MSKYLIFIIVKSLFLSAEVFLAELSLAAALKVFTVLTVFSAKVLAVLVKLLAPAALLAAAVKALVATAVLAQVVAMEGKAQYVGLFVLLLLFQTFFELALLLKAVLLGHLALLLFGLHRATFLTENFHLAVE